MANSSDGQLLARILDTPGLARLVPQLSPEILHRVIDRCGLEDCAELVSLATSEQLRGVLDIDLWRSAKPGHEEQFDADRFGAWLETLLESGADFAAAQLARFDPPLVITGLSAYVRVYDAAAVAAYETTDGIEMRARISEDEFACKVGGYVIVPKRHDAWDAISIVLPSLEADHSDVFHRVMQGCRLLSSEGRELDGLDNLLADDRQAMFDLANEREQRRERQGYATPALARAFLRDARQLKTGIGDDPISPSPLAAAYFRALNDDIESEAGVAPSAATSVDPDADRPKADAKTGDVTELVDLLVDAGVLPEPARALLEAGTGGESRLTKIETFLREAAGNDVRFARANQELAFVSNILLAGCTLQQGRALTAQEASQGALAICNLGLEGWPHHWPAAPDAVAAFQVGWKILYEEVCLFSAQRLIDALGAIHCSERDVQIGINDLRRTLIRRVREGEPWRAGDDFDGLIALDLPTWAALIGLIAECPVIHAAMRGSTRKGMLRIDPDAFEFISEERQIAEIRDFAGSLPTLLVG